MSSAASSRRHASVVVSGRTVRSSAAALLARQVECGAAGKQIPQKDVQTVQDPDAFAGQVVAALGKQTQLRCLILGHDRPEPFAAHCDMGNACRVSRIALAGSAGIKQPRPGGQGGRHIDHVLATGRE